LRRRRCRSSPRPSPIPRSAAKAFGLYGGIAVAGGAIGLLLGGVLTEYLSWRWCLYVNIFFAIPAALGAIRLLHRQDDGAGLRLDIPGTATASLGLLALVYACSEAATRGWGDPLILSLFAVAAVLLTAFVAIERRSEHPLLADAGRAQTQPRRLLRGDGDRRCPACSASSSSSPSTCRTRSASARCRRGSPSCR